VKLAKIASKFHLKEKAEYWEQAAEKIRKYVYENCFNQELNRSSSNFSKE
jgi:GH15 family glucan-1,4-alpha-glucosidase